MLTLTEIKIQESPSLRGVNADKGITPADLTCARVLLADGVQDAIHAKMSDVLSDYMVQIADFATENGKDGSAVLASMEANIARFKLDAGGGYTDTCKASLLADGTASGVEVLAEDFVKPENRNASGGEKKATSATTGEMSL